MKRSKKRIAVIGGGITGLTAAYRIKKIIETESLPFELIVLEAGLRAGGMVYTASNQGQMAELGATSIDTRYSEGVQLVKELGMEDQLVYSKGNKPDIFFYNQLNQLPYPTYNGIPINKSDIWKTDLLTFNGKIASFKDSFIGSISTETDISVNEFLKKRLGDELVDHIVEPFFTKVYASSLNETGIRSSQEIIYFLEQEYGSISKGLAAHQELADQTGNFVTFKTGLSTLTEKLAEILEPHIQYGKRVVEIREGIKDTYIVGINNKEEVRVGALCIAVPVVEYQKLFAEEKQLSKLFNQIKTYSVGYMVFSFLKQDVPIEPKGFGVVMPQKSDSIITSIVFLNKKWPSLYQSDNHLVGVSFGRNGEDLLVDLSNKEIEELILKDLMLVLGISNSPMYKIIKRWPNAIPQYTVKKENQINKINSILAKQYQGIYLAGNGQVGYGINQCIRQGNNTAINLLNYLKKQHCI